MLFRSPTSLNDKQVKHNVLTAKKSGNPKIWQIYQEGYYVFSVRSLSKLIIKFIKIIIYNEGEIFTKKCKGNK